MAFGNALLILSREGLLSSCFGSYLEDTQGQVMDAAAYFAG